MRRMLAAAVALSLLGSAHASGGDLSPMGKFRYDTTYEHGRLLKLKTPRGVARYEYDQAGKLRRKILPKGVIVDYYHDRDGRLVETRFSTGLVRTRHYDRSGKLTHIIGSDGYTLKVDGAGANATVVVTGPNDYRADLTPMLKKARTSYASRMGKVRPKAMLVLSGDAGGCSFSWWGGMDCNSDGGGGGDGGAGGSYDDSWGGGGDGGDGGGAADEWGGDSGAGDYGDDAGYGNDGGSADSDGGGGSDEGGGDVADSGWDGMGGGEQTPEPGSPGNNLYLQCMAVNCERQNQDFRDFCSRELPQHQEMCYRYTAKYYFKCERECWYTSY